MSIHNYNNMIPWSELRDFLESRLAQTRAIEEAENDQLASVRLKGQIQLLKALLNLPDALTNIAEAKEAEKNAG